MTIAFVGSSVATGTLVGTEPSGVQQGDLLIAIAGNGDNITGGSVPSQVEAPGSWAKRGASTASDYSVGFSYIVRGSSAPNLTWTHSIAATSHARVVILAYRGVESVPNADLTNIGTGEPDEDAPSLTTTVDDCLLVCFWGSRLADASVTFPGGMTQRAQTPNTFAAEEVLGAAGATGARTLTGMSNPLTAWSIALAPAIEEPPPPAGITPQGGIEVGGTADVAFVHGSDQVPGDVVVEIDWDNDGDFDQPEEQVTEFLFDAESMTGRDFPSQLTGKAGPGQFKGAFRNDDGRFSYFNQDSPLNQGANRLKVGRKIRLRTSDAANPDPLLLARDRFNGSDGVLGTAETGQQWIGQASSFRVEGNAATAVEPTEGSDADGFRSAVVDTDAVDTLYVQATIGLFPPFSSIGAGLVTRWVDSDNFVFARISSLANELWLGECVAGVLTTLEEYGDENLYPWPGITLGLKDGPDDEIMAYINGVPVLSATTSLSFNGIAGLQYGWSSSTAPTFDDFHVWDDLVVETEGILWTGNITKIHPSAQLGPNNIVAIDAEGQLAKAALVDVVSPRATHGAPTGLLVGDVLSKARLLHPSTIDEGVVFTGPVGLADDKALTLARHFEETEVGFLYETQEGPIAFESKAARVGRTVQAWFSDQPEAQFGYQSLDLLDWHGEIVNRVTAGVTAEQPTVVGVNQRSNSTAINVTNHVDVLLPTTEDGDLLVVFIASTVASSGRGWNAPIWWTAHRQFGSQDDDSVRTRIYSHSCDGSESGATIRFYTAATNIGGAWVAQIYRIKNWYQGGSHSVAMGEFVQGDSPGPIDHGWGQTSVLFIAANAALTSLDGGSFDTDVSKIPDGYYSPIQQFLNGAVNGADVGLHTAVRSSVDGTDHPTAFGGFQGFVFNESVVFAVRGFNGPHIVLPTLQNPTQFQASPGRFVTVDDVDSQEQIGVIRSHENPSNLFATEEDAGAYADAVIVTYADDRPIITVSFPATLNAAYRNQAIRRRVGHKIHLTADGDTGMGIDGDFFIENVGHKLSNAGKVWWVTWQLSPV